MSRHLGKALAFTTALTVSALFGAPAQAATPLGGLTVAVTAKGDKLVVGGNTRTLVVIDPNSLEVKARHWIGASIVGLEFNADGSVLAVEDTSGTVYLYDTNTWKSKYTLRKHSMMTLPPSRTMFAGVDNSYRGAIIHFNSLKDGSNMGQIELQNKEQVAALGFSKDGKRLGVLLRGVKSPDEKEVRYSEIPKDLRGLARDDFRQRNDGKVSTFRIYEVPSGKMLSEKTTFFNLGNQGRLALDDEGITVLGYYSLGARIKMDGSANVFKTKNSSNYGVALTPDHSLWISGSLGSYTLTANPALTTKATGRLNRLPSWPEYFKGFAATADNGAIYGTTTAYRIVKIGGDGKLIKAMPIR